jgi:hypothetical protein
MYSINPSCTRKSRRNYNGAALLSRQGNSWFGSWCILQALDGSRKGGLAYKEQRQPHRDVTFFRFFVSSLPSDDAVCLPLSLWMINLRVRWMPCNPLIRKVMYSINPSCTRKSYRNYNLGNGGGTFFSCVVSFVLQAIFLKSSRRKAPSRGSLFIGQ